MKHTIRALAVAASSVALVGSGVAATAAPTSGASVSQSGAVAQSGSAAKASAAWACPKERLCVWTGKNGTGTRAVFKRGDVNLTDATGPRGMNNNISSFKNTSYTHHWRLFDGTKYNGKSRVVHWGQQGNLAKRMNDQTSSIKRVGDRRVSARPPPARRARRGSRAHPWGG